MVLSDALPAGPIAIDTSIVIYFVEQHDVYLPIIRPLFGHIGCFTLAELRISVSG